MPKGWAAERGSAAQPFPARPVWWKRDGGWGRGDGWSARDEAGLAEKAGGDLWLDVRLTRGRPRHLAKKDPELVEYLVALGHIRVRFCLVDIGGKEPERLVCDLGEDVLPKCELKDTYWIRWVIETTYGYMKNQFQLENFTGTRAVLIEQDIYATAYLTDLAFDLAGEANEAAQERIERRAKETGREHEHEMAVNHTHLIGRLKDRLYEVILADDRERADLMAALADRCSRVLEPVRPDRPPQPRDGLDTGRGNALKYHNNRKRAF